MLDRPSPKKLEVLTSLRFFAAALIVVHHSRGSFGLSQQLGEPFMFDQGVAFFFVLSGFILTYVYPSLETFGRRRFVLARIARVWPAHVAALILLLLLQPAAVPSVWDGHSLRILVANLFMVHAWIPLGEYFFSFNSPSWSISTEFGFYLCFLGLIPNWRRTWATKLTVVCIVLAGLILFGNAWNVPAWTPTDTRGLTLDGLVYVSPFARLLEFTLGMTTALAWAHLRPRVRSGLLVGTLLEVSLLGLVVYTMYQSPRWAYLAGDFGPIGSAGRVWLVHAGFSCLPFAALILVMALERGLVSRLLAFPLLVLLGEISYSLYLIHQVLLRYYAQHAPALALIPGWVAYLVFWAMTLLGAYVTWAVVERPARRFLVGLWPRRPAERETGVAARNPASPTRAVHDSMLDPGWRGGLAGMVLLLILVLPIGYLMTHRVVLSAIDGAAADALANRGPQVARGVRFGERFVLLGADIQRTGAGLTLELAWQSLETQSLKYSIPVHLVNDAGTILGQADYAQGGGARDEIHAGAIWRDLVSIPQAKLAGASAIGIGLIDPVSSNWLLADRGPRDWADRRLLLPLPAGASLDYEGFHDATDCAGISGWAWDRSRPDSPIAVDIYDGGRLLATLPADRFRKDLREGGKGNGLHGLTYVWPLSVRDGRPHTIRLKVSGTDVELQNTARSITCSSGTPAYDGFHEVADCLAISGWALDKNHPDSPINADIFDDNMLLATVPAIGPRPDLRAAGLGTGTGGFRYAVPTSLKDGQPHAIRIRYSRTGIDVRNTPKTITCEPDSVGR